MTKWEIEHGKRIVKLDKFNVDYSKCPYVKLDQLYKEILYMNVDLCNRSERLGMEINRIIKLLKLEISFRSKTNKMYSKLLEFAVPKTVREYPPLFFYISREEAINEGWTR